MGLFEAYSIVVMLIKEVRAFNKIARKP